MFDATITVDGVRYVLCWSGIREFWYYEKESEAARHMSLIHAPEGAACGYGAFMYRISRKPGRTASRYFGPVAA